MENEKEIQELKSAEELHRFEASMMLGQTAVYLVACGTLLNGVLNKDPLTFEKIGISIFGILLSISFLLIAHRTGENLRGARKRAEEIGSSLGFKIYSSEYRAKRSKIFVGKNITKSICFCGGILWLTILTKLVTV